MFQFSSINPLNQMIHLRSSSMTIAQTLLFFCSQKKEANQQNRVDAKKRGKKKYLFSRNQNG